MQAIGTYEIIGAFGDKLSEVCSIQRFGATYQGIEVVIEVRDYARHPAGRFHLWVRRTDGREARSDPANTLSDAVKTIQWQLIED
jgi:hypothetical protein